LKEEKEIVWPGPSINFILQKKIVRFLSFDESEIFNQLIIKVSFLEGQQERNGLGFKLGEQCGPR
jgi:hypothetical protein